MVEASSAVQPRLAAGVAPVQQRRRTTAQERDRGAVRHVLHSSQDDDVQQVVDLLRAVCDVEMATVAVADGDTLRHVVSAGLVPGDPDRVDVLSLHALASDERVVVRDARQDLRFRSSPLDGRSMSVRFYASAPLHSPSGSRVGSLCLLDSAPRDLDPVQLQALDTLAVTISSILELRLRRREEAEAGTTPPPPHHADEKVSVASQVSHDLRVPLTSLSTSLALLEESTPVDESSLRRNLLASARRGAARMAALVDGLLRLNDVQRGLQVATVDLEEVVHQVLVDLEAPLKEVEAQVSVGPLTAVRGDADLVTAALLNLVGNAAKFTRPGRPPEINISARRTATGVRVSVRDQGIGIPVEDRQRVFALFARLTPTSGHGIGLTTVARVAEAHGGRVGIDDNPAGVGSDIWFELPG